MSIHELYVSIVLAILLISNIVLAMIILHQRANNAKMQHQITQSILTLKQASKALSRPR